MSISYPLTPPTVGAPVSVQWFPRPNVSVSTSPFTGAQQVLVRDGDQWLVSFALEALELIDADPWTAFLTNLNGPEGSFWFGPVLKRLPRGVATGTPKVNGANQTGRTLATDGWTANAAVLKKGDFIQIGNSLYKVGADVTASAGGAANIELWPSLRAHADNAVIVCNSPKCLMRLLEAPSWTENEDHMWVMEINAQEVLG